MVLLRIIVHVLKDLVVSFMDVHVIYCANWRSIVFFSVRCGNFFYFENISSKILETPGEST